MRKASLTPITMCILAACALAQTPYVPKPDGDPFVGTWKTNADKSVPKLTGDDASYTRVFARKGDDLIVFSSEGKKRIRKKYELRCDGSFHPIPHGSMSCMYKDSHYVEGETRLVNHELDYWTREVSPDGQQMKILAFKDHARTQLLSTWILDRIK